jgi:hypothetical protein
MLVSAEGHSLSPEPTAAAELWTPAVAIGSGSNGMQSAFEEELVMPIAREKPVDDPWDVFELDDDAAEPEPEPGDFWGEPDDDSDDRGQ